MAVNSISGINLKIGADLSELKQEVGKVGQTVQNELGGETAKPVKDLSDDFKDSAKNAAKTAISAAAVAVAMGKIGKALTGFTKGIVEDALAVHPETKQKVDDVKNAFDTMKVTLGESLIPLIDEWAPKITDMLNRVSNWAKENPETAKTMLEVVGALGALSSAMALALPVITMFNLAALPISGTFVAISASIVATITLLALLSTSLDEIGTKAEKTAEKIAKMDTTTQYITENGIGELEVVDRDASDYFWADNVWDPVKKEFTEGWTYLDQYTGEYVLVSEDVVNAASQSGAAISETTAALTEETAAMEETTAATETTKSAAEQAQEIFQQMQTSIESTTAALGEGGMTDALDNMNSILESEAFKQFASQPVSEDVAESWQSFGESVSKATDGFSTIKGLQGDDGLIIPSIPEETITSWQNFSKVLAGDEEEGTIGLAANLVSVKTTIDGILTSSQNLASYWNGDFMAAILALEIALCIPGNDSEGNTSANGGNTLYNALGAISGVLDDILTKTQNIVGEWTGSFVQAAEEAKKASGKVEGAFEGAATAAQNAATAFGNAAQNLRDYLAAQKEYDEYMSGGGGGGGTSGSGGNPNGYVPKLPGMASGGYISAGDSVWVGENGPEIFTPKYSGTITPNDELGSIGPTITVNIGGNIYGESYLQEYVVGTLTRAVRQELTLAS